MALRSVVVEPPAARAGAPRHTVVLRAGGPAPKGKAIDLVALAVGVLLLLACVALAQLLPDKTYLNPQFRLSFVDQSFSEPLGSHDFLEGTAETFDFTYDVPQDNVNAITVDVFFRDDLDYSHPDRFAIELIDPAGNLVGDQQQLESPRPITNGASMELGEAQQEPLTFTVLDHPTEQIVGGLAHTETKEQALAREEPKYRQATAGTWTVRVRLLAAGDCPLPTEPEYSALQQLYCNYGDPSQVGVPGPTAVDRAGGEDRGNPLSIEGFSYSWYTPVIEQLK